MNDWIFSIPEVFTTMWLMRAWSRHEPI